MAAGVYLNAAAIAAASLCFCLCFSPALPFAPPAFAQSPDSTYWGAAPADSSPVVLSQPGLPAWEAVVVYPWRVITYPIKLVGQGLGALVVAGDRSPVVRDVFGLLSPPPRIIGFSPTITAGGLNGFGGGLTMYDNEFLNPDNRARLSAGVTTNGSQYYRAGALFNEPGRTSVEVGGSYRLRRKARFFGVGPDTDPADEAFFGLETTWGGIGLNRKLGNNWDVQVSALATSAGTRPSIEGDDQGVPEVFGANPPFGYGVRSDGGLVGFDVTAGEPRTHVRPDDEALLRVHVGYFDDWNGTSPSYWAGRVTARRYFPLFFPQRTLGLRGVMAWTDPVGHGEIPFQRMNSNHGLDRFRGYQDFRFTDNGLAMLSAEYRWPIWVTKEAWRPGLDFILLADAGQVYREVEQITLDRLALSYGFALEYAGSSGLLARVEFGWSEEDQVIRFGLVNLLETGSGQIFLTRVQDREP